jgi:hypothetical protein
MAEIYQLRDFQSKKTEERIKQMAAEIMSQDTAPSEIIPGGGAGIDGLYFAPDQDPA